MNHKVRMVPITSDLNSVPNKVAIKDGELFYKVNGSWVKYVNSPDPDLDGESIGNAINQLELFSKTKLALDRPDSLVPFYFRHNYLKIDKVEYNTEFPESTKTPELPEILDYDELKSRFNKIIKYSTSLRVDHRISHVTPIKIPDGIKLIKIRLIYNLVSEVESESETVNHIRNISLDTFNGITYHDNLFTTKISNNRLTILTSENVYQVFIRNINFYN